MGSDFDFVAYLRDQQQKHIAIEVTDPSVMDEIRDSLSATREATGADGSTVLLYRLGKVYGDCLALALDGQMIGFMHGTDCRFTHSFIGAPANVPMIVNGCHRRMAGGAFRVFHIPRQGDEVGAL